jgi:hypothetical protein
MTYQERQTSITRERATQTTAPGSGTAVDVRETETSIRPSGMTVAMRVVTLLFGLVQLVIGLRVVLLALDAREANDLVRGILDVSQVFVAPFEGILQTNAMSANGSVLDIAALVALVGWTIVELIVLQIMRLGRPGPDA